MSTSVTPTRILASAINRYTSPSASFMNTPFYADNTQLSHAKAAILGLPYDCGSDPKRIGARFGPDSIRKMSHLISHFDGATNISPVQALKLIDMGDARVDLTSIENTYKLIELAMSQIIEHSIVPITLGGDGAVALPQMRALSKKHRDLVVLHIDAHTDAYILDEYSNATPFTHAVREHLIQPESSFHIGRRGSHFVPNVVSDCKSLGYNLIDMQALQARGIQDVMLEVKKVIGTKPVYICFDMDFFDPSAAPGVCSPTFGGATSTQGLNLIRACQGLNIVAADVNTISPEHDVQGMSALLAGAVVFELLLLIAQA